MTATKNILSQSFALSGSRPGPIGASRSLASEIKRHWKHGEPPDARAALSQHPELKHDKSVILDLAYEEFCLQLEAGKTPDPDEFCERFPTFKTSLRRLIEAHNFLEDNSHLLGDGQAVKWPEAGESFLGFQLVRELGRGAFARVFLATEPALGERKVAVKISLQGHAEAETLGRIDHPNIVPVHSVREDSTTGLTAVCMPYLGAATLCDVLDQAFLDGGPPARAQTILSLVRERSSPEGVAVLSRAPDSHLTRGAYLDGVVHLGAQLADGLACIHAKGICHRDLKPSNVLMTPAGRPMLLDFNLSSDEHAIESRLGGTLPYMAPEQLRATDLSRGRPGLIDGRSDLFSLGVILYELLTGSHPFGPLPLKLTTQELRKHLLQKQQEGIRPVRSQNSQVDVKLARIIEKCLAFDPEQRPQAAAEVATSLRRCLGGARRFRRWLTVHPRVVAAAILTGMATMFGGAYGFSTQEPYHLRLMEWGQESFEKGQYKQAVGFFTKVVEGDPKNSEALYLRGRAYQKLGKWDEALIDGKNAANLNPQDIHFGASLGYCLTMNQLWNEADKYYFEAIKAGFGSAEIYNNLACGAANRPPDLSRTLDLDTNVYKYLAEAIRLDPTLQAPYHNLAVFDLKRALMHRDYVPEVGISHMKIAVQIGPPSGRLYGNAFLLNAIAAQNARLAQVRNAVQIALSANILSTAGAMASESVPYDRRWLESAGQCLELAMKGGWDPRDFELAWSPIQNEPEVRDLLNESIPEGVKCSESAMVLDPIKDAVK